MKRFDYFARDSKNAKIQGLVDAIDETEAIRILRSRSLLVTKISEKRNSIFSDFLASIQKVKTQDVLNFTRQLSTMITAGLSINESLSIIGKQSTAAMKKVIKQIIKDVEGGSSLYIALGKNPALFSKTYLALIKSGESAGVLDSILLRLADTLEKDKEFKSKIKGALIYPIIVVIGMMVVSFVMMVFVIPKITDMFLEFDLELPFATRALMFGSNLMAKYWLLFIALIAVFFVFFKKWHKTESGKTAVDDMTMKMPIIGPLSQQVIFTEMTRTLSLLISGGVSIIESLNIVADVTSNKIFENAIKEIAVDVEKGGMIGACFSRYEFFPPIISQMMSVGEETGKLDEILMKVSRHFEMESEFSIKGLTSAIEPLMIILLGVGVGFLVIAVIMPIYKLTSSF